MRYFNQRLPYEHEVRQPHIAFIFPCLERKPHVVRHTHVERQPHSARQLYVVIKIKAINHGNLKF